MKDKSNIILQIEELSKISNELKDNEVCQIIKKILDLINDIYILIPQKRINRCKYCSEHTDSQDPNILCPNCRETFGHSFFSEL